MLDFCEEHGHDFCVGADLDEAVKKVILAVKEEAWRRINVPKDPADPEDHVREWACETVLTLNESKFEVRSGPPHTESHTCPAIWVPDSFLIRIPDSVP